MSTKRTTAVGYVRVSRVGGRGGDSFLSPDLQREEIDRAAKREGLEVVEVLEELDASGGDAKRPLWNEAIRRVEDGEVRAVVVWNLSRFSRSVRDAIVAYNRIRAAGGRLLGELRVALGVRRSLPVPLAPPQSVVEQVAHAPRVGDGEESAAAARPLQGLRSRF